MIKKKQFINSPFPNLKRSNFYSITNNEITKLKHKTNNKINLGTYSTIDIAPNDDKIVTSFENAINIMYFNKDKKIILTGSNPIWDLKSRLFYQKYNQIYCNVDNNDTLIYQNNSDKPLSFYITKNRKYLVVIDSVVKYKNLDLDSDFEEFKFTNGKIYNQEDSWLFIKDNQVFVDQDEKYKPLFPENSNVKFNKLEVFKTFLVFWVEINNDSFIWLYKDKQITPVQNLDLAYSLNEAINLDYYTRYYRYLYESPIVPITLIEIDSITFNSTILETAQEQTDLYRMSTLQLPKSKKLITVLKHKDLKIKEKFKFNSRIHKFNSAILDQIDKKTCVVLGDSVEEKSCIEYLKNTLF